MLRILGFRYAPPRLYAWSSASRTFNNRSASGFHYRYTPTANGKNGNIAHLLLLLSVLFAVCCLPFAHLLFAVCRLLLLTGVNGLWNLLCLSPLLRVFVTYQSTHTMYELSVEKVDIRKLACAYVALALAQDEAKRYVSRYSMQVPLLPLVTSLDITAALLEEVLQHAMPEKRSNLFGSDDQLEHADVGESKQQTANGKQPARRSKQKAVGSRQQTDRPAY